MMYSQLRNVAPLWALIAVTAAAQDSVVSLDATQRVPWSSSRFQGTPDPPSPYRTERVFPKLSFTEPLDMAAVPGTDRLLVSERYGKIYSFRNDPAVERGELFLDLGKVIYGFAIHPRFAETGHVFVTYVLDPAKEEPRGTRVSRFTVRPDNRWLCDPASEQVVLEWPSGGHNGGCLRFGPDGMLYVATGDSSGIADSLLTGQDLSDLSGSILRIDVERRDGARPYAIPSDNPFVGTANARPEIWAYGLRQPWRMHFDPATGDLWTGNVGQDLWEQVLLVERGGNYGWSVTEGSHAFRPERPRGPTPLLPPVVEHDHAEFRSITGGTVYHGGRLPELRGAYVYADYDTGQVWMLRYDRRDRRVSDWRQLVDSSLRVVGFGEDAAGELYLIDHMGGGLHRLTPNTAAGDGSAFPRRLSETGLFSDVARHTLAPGVIPYSVAAPQWTDGTTKQRYFALPGQSQIEFEAVTYPQPAPGAWPGWRFPDGAVAAETIYLEMEPGNRASRRRIETRVLHYEQLAGTEEIGDQFWRGYSYVWNDEQTDAVLVEAAGMDRTFALRDAAAPGGVRPFTWHIPSRAECTVCHNMAAKYVLGLTTAQLNRTHEFRGSAENQLQVYDRWKLFTQPLNKSPSELPRLVDYRDETQGLADRARSYLHANCSHCHRKWGGGNTEFQLLASLDVKELGIIGVRPAHGGFYLPNAEIVAPGDPLQSVLFYRMAKLGPGRMPRLGSDVVDSYGIDLIRRWIASLPRTAAASPNPAPADDGAPLERLLTGSLPPDEAAQLVQTLLSSTRGALRLMLALDEGRFVTVPQLWPVVVGTAAASPDAHIRDLFEKYLPESRRPKRLGASIKAETLLALPGDAAEGRRLFFETEGVQCRTCHKIRGQGADVGPDLSQIGKKYDRARILDNILNPSRDIDPKYVVHLAETEDGRLVSGLLVEKSPSAIVLKDAKNQLLRLEPSQVRELTPQQQSLMPDLLLRDLTAQQVADLLAYLSELKE